MNNCTTQRVIEVAAQTHQVTLYDAVGPTLEYDFQADAPVGHRIELKWLAYYTSGTVNSSELYFRSKQQFGASSNEARVVLLDVAATSYTESVDRRVPVVQGVYSDLVLDVVLAGGSDIWLMFEYDILPVIRGDV